MQTYLLVLPWPLVSQKPHWVISCLTLWVWLCWIVAFGSSRGMDNRNPSGVFHKNCLHRVFLAICIISVKKAVRFKTKVWKYYLAVKRIKASTINSSLSADCCLEIIGIHLLFSRSKCQRLGSLSIPVIESRRNDLYKVSARCSALELVLVKTVQTLYH